jgi:hypothetical protein
MRRVVTAVAGLVLTVACSQISKSTQQIPAVAVKLELVAIGRAEARYQVENSTYGTIEQLQKAELLTGDPDRNGYAFTIEVNGSESFSVTASPADEKNKAWPTYTLNQAQQVVER